MEEPNPEFETRNNPVRNRPFPERFRPEEEVVPKKTRKAPVLSKEDFDAYIDNLVGNEKLLREAAEEVYALPKGKSFTIPPNAQFPRFDKPFSVGRMEMKKLFSEHQKSLKYIKRLYASALEYKEKRPVKKKPAVFIDSLISFFRHVDLGPVWVFDEETGDWVTEDAPLQTALPLFFDRGIAYTETVINLFYIYSYRNNLQKGSEYHANQEMLEYLGPVFNAIIEYDTAHPKKARKTPTPGKRKGPVREMGGVFNPQSFAITGFNRIARWTRYFRSEEKDIPQGAPVLTEEQYEDIRSPELSEVMDKEFTASESSKYINKLQRDRRLEKGKGKEKA